MSWVCDKCGITTIFWNDEIGELVCEECGQALDVGKAKLVVLSTDRISERGTCEFCGLENAQLVAKCARAVRNVVVNYA
jgi:hypothetical protein